MVVYPGINKSPRLSAKRSPGLTKPAQEKGDCKMIKVYLALLCKVFFDIALMACILYGIVQVLLGMGIGNLLQII